MKYLIEIIYLLVIASIFAVGFFYLMREYGKFHHYSHGFLALLMVTGILESGLKFIEYSIDSYYNIWIGWFYMIAKWTLILRALLLVAFAEYISKEHIRKRFVVLIAILGAIVIVLDILWMIAGNGMVPNDRGIMLHLLDKPSDYAYFLLTFSGIIGIDISYKIYKAAPLSLKKPAQQFLLGFIVIGISFPLFEFDRIIEDAQTRIPFGITLLLGLLLITRIIIKNSQLAYVLPFKVFRLTVLENMSGLALYTYTWTGGKNFVDEDLYSGMLQGIRSLIQESIKKGDLKEIKTDSAVLLINNCDGTQITMILAASNDSILLRNALISFSIEFCEKYAKFINSFGDVSEFRSAKEIVEKRFLFVPD